MKNKNCKLAIEFALSRLGSLDNGVNYQDHLGKVLKYGRFLQKRYGGDMEIVELSCVLHDVGMEKRVKNHGFLGRKVARKFLGTIPVPPDKMRRILYCIAHHNDGSSSEEPLELRIIRDADGVANFKNSTAIALLLYRAYRDEKREFIAGIEGALNRCDATYRRLVFPESKKIAKREHSKLRKFFSNTLGYLRRRDGKREE